MARNPALGTFPKRIRRHEEEIRQLRLREIGGGAAIVTIAPSNYPKRAMADYVCTGTDDQNTLQQALSDGFSHFLLLPGDFYFTDAPWQGISDWGPDRWVTVQGLGRATVIHVLGNVGFYPCYDGTYGAEIRDMAFSVEESGSTAINQPSPPTLDRCLLHNLFLSTPDSAHVTRDGIVSFGNSLIFNITFGFFYGTDGIDGWGDDGQIDRIFANQFTGDVVAAINDNANRWAITNSKFIDNTCGTSAVFWGNGSDGLLQGIDATGTTGPADANVGAAVGLREVGNLIGVRV